MIKKYQVTLFCADGTYKPVASIVNNQQDSDIDLSKNSEERKKLQKMGIEKICNKRYWNVSDLKKYNFTKCKIRAVE